MGPYYLKFILGLLTKLQLLHYKYAITNIFKYLICSTVHCNHIWNTIKKKMYSEGKLCKKVDLEDQSWELLSISATLFFTRYRSVVESLQVMLTTYHILKINQK